MLKWFLSLSLCSSIHPVPSGQLNTYFQWWMLVNGKRGALGIQVIACHGLVFDDPKQGIMQY
jgi:hypothetical protein